MECPFCSYDNIEGSDQCARCGVDLADLDVIKDKSDIELDLLHRPLGDLIAQTRVQIKTLEQARAALETRSDEEAAAGFALQAVVPAMAVLRQTCDAAEKILPKDKYPYPTIAELLCGLTTDR